MTRCPLSPSHGEHREGSDELAECKREVEHQARVRDAGRRANLDHLLGLGLDKPVNPALHESPPPGFTTAESITERLAREANRPATTHDIDGPDY